MLITQSSNSCQYNVIIVASNHHSRLIQLILPPKLSCVSDILLSFQHGCLRRYIIKSYLRDKGFYLPPRWFTGSLCPPFWSSIIIWLLSLIISMRATWIFVFLRSYSTYTFKSCKSWLLFLTIKLLFFSVSRMIDWSHMIWIISEHFKGVSMTENFIELFKKYHDGQDICDN